MLGQEFAFFCNKNGFTSIYETVGEKYGLTEQLTLLSDEWAHIHNIIGLPEGITVYIGHQIFILVFLIKKGYCCSKETALAVNKVLAHVYW